MKLERMMSGVVVVGVLALACGCSSSTASKAPATAAAIPNNVGTTSLMSAELLGPAPKVGKSHLVIDGDDMDVGSTSDASEESAPKEARRSDGSHRAGGFGSSK